MSFEIRYLPIAVEDLDRMAAYLSRFYPDTAGKALRGIEKKLKALQTMPEMYPVYLPNTFYRKMSAGKYLVFYHVNEQARTVDICRILRASWDVEKQIPAQDESRDSSTYL